VNKYVQHFLLLGGGKLFRIPPAILVISLLSRLIGPEGVGQWSMLAAISSLFQLFFLQWTQASLVRFGREEWLDSKNLSKIWAARWPLILFSLTLATLLLALRPFSFFERLTSLPSNLWTLAAIYLLGLWCLAEAQSLLTVTSRLTRLAVLPLIADTFIILFLLFLSFTTHEEVKFLPFVGIVFLTTIFWGTMWVKEFIFTRSFGDRLSVENTLRVIKFGWPMIPVYILGYLSDWGDHFLLQYFHGAKEVGFFHAGYQMMFGIMTLASPLVVILIPKLIDMKRMDQNGELNYISGIVPTISTLWLLAIMPCIALLPWVFGVVFGEKFIEAHPAFYVLSIAIPGAVFSSLYTVLFNVQGRLKYTGLFSAVMFSVNIVISLLLVPVIGSLGAAIATTVSYLLWQYLYIFDQHRFLNVSKERAMILFTFSSIYGLLQLMIGDELIIRLGGAFAGLICLIILSRRLNFVDKTILKKIFPENYPGYHLVQRVLI
jgi:O-antigen/teichoic acid export membrane protein